MHCLFYIACFFLALQAALAVPTLASRAEQSPNAKGQYSLTKSAGSHAEDTALAMAIRTWIRRIRTRLGTLEEGCYCP
ncbi:putative signal peptide protein [Puccinia sorghi]|uniref:Putative signal peptide protein n=1 Tax=Puccinia sorghi TaxID=27349 RepID=A0A0L6UEC2_9BASI|nr:putative signal peptide protein [Puccinia sorghi]